MWQSGLPPANLDYSITVGGEFYGFIEQESAFTGEITTVGVWRSGGVFGPIRASAAQCTAVALILLILVIASAAFVALMWRSQRMAARRRG
jgi:hypothetical protein